MIFVDSSFIIALTVEKDQWHKKALEKLNKFTKEEKIIIEAMIIESINLIGKCRRKSWKNNFSIHSR